MAIMHGFDQGMVNQQFTSCTDVYNRVVMGLRQVRQLDGGQQ